MDVFNFFHLYCRNCGKKKHFAPLIKGDEPDECYLVEWDCECKYRNYYQFRTLPNGTVQMWGGGSAHRRTSDGAGDSSD